MFIFIILLAAPVLVGLNVIWHFMRARMLIYEIICNIIGIGLMFFMLALDLALCIPRDIYSAVGLCIPLLLPFGVVCYLYGKYTFDSPYKRTAMILSVLCAAAEVLWIGAYVFLGGGGHGLSSMGIFLFYYYLVPLNFIVTSISEAVLQALGSDVYGDQRE